VRRHLTIAMICMVAGALVVAGVVTFAVTVHSARVTDRKQLVAEAHGLAVTVRAEAATIRPRDPAASLRAVIRALREPLRLQGEAVVAIGPQGRLFNPVQVRQAVRLPGGLRRADLDVPALLELHTVSGQSGGLIFAAVPYRTSVQVGTVNRSELQVVVLTRRPPTGLAAAGPWFLGATVAIILTAVVVAGRLVRRFMRPLLAVQRTTERIAAGDLHARVSEPPGADPELVALQTSVNAMADSVARSRELERAFLLSVSHDLRTPLTSIRGFAEAIEDGVMPDTAQAAATIALEARRLERLVGDLLDLAKLDSSQFSLNLAPVDLAEVVEATTGGFGPEAAARGLILNVPSGPTASLAVTADADRLGQVIANLVDNALSFARTSVWVGAGSPAGRPVLWVDDDGPGIAQADLPRVFERQYSSRRDSGRPVGSGLGLAIVHELVEAMGGRIWVESPLFGPRGGTRFVVTLRPWP
jgi:signal transduction histidine kinase